MTELIHAPDETHAVPGEKADSTPRKSRRPALRELLTGSGSTWHSYLTRAGIAYIVSRICVVTGAAVVASQRVIGDRVEGIPRPSNAVGKIADVLTSWDGKWYFALIRDSYPDHVPRNVTWDDYQARTAFFPVYPDLVRIFDRVLPGGDVLAGLVLNVILGAAAVYLTGLIARQLFDEQVAYRAMLLMALFPGSFVLSFSYSEATLLVVAAGSMLCLLRRQWLAAGLLAAIGAATRPNGVALIAACAVAAFLAIRQRREWRALLAPAIAPIGFIGFHLFLWHRTGERTVWFRTQSEAWDEGTSFGLTALRNTAEAFTKPLSSPTDIITAVSFLTMLVLIAMAWRKRLPWPIVTYSAVVLILMLAPSTVTARPRFLYTAFPLLISAAAWIRDAELRRSARRAPVVAGAGPIADESHELWTLVLVAGAAGLVALTALYGVFGAIP